MMSNSTGGIDLKLSYGGAERALFITGSQGAEGRPGIVYFDENTALAVPYGAKRKMLPFAIRLRDFIMERYPGTNSASSYASEVTLVDQRKNMARDQRIYMNHILDYEGYRFFQSSYDPDELGTCLSVNYDAPGTLVSYLGYLLLTLGMVLTLFSKNSRFRQLAENPQRMRQPGKAAVACLVALCMAIGSPLMAGPPAPEGQGIGAAHAKRFGRILVQDHND